MKISCIVATAHDNVIGKDNDIPWYLPADLKYFKKTTLGHPIIMGRNCYQSIGRPLPKRTNIIVSRNPFFIVSNCLVAHDIAEALELAHEEKPEEVFIIGGGTIYDQTQDLWDRLYLTQVDLNVEGDIFFPKLDMSKWKMVSETKHLKDEKNQYDYRFLVFDKRL